MKMKTINILATLFTISNALPPLSITVRQTPSAVNAGPPNPPTLTTTTASNIQPPPTNIPLPKSPFANGLVQAMENLNANVLSNVVKISPVFFENLLTDTPKTFLIPTNDAIYETANIENFTQFDFENLIYYHILDSQLNASDTSGKFVMPSTLRNYTQLPDGNPQVVSLEVNNSQISINGLLSNATVEGTSTYQNVHLYTINEILQIPYNFIDTLNAINLTTVTGLIDNVPGMNDELLSMAGLTAFIPTQEALQNVSNSISVDNPRDIVLNYVLTEGTVNYSPNLGDGQELQTASGNTLTVSRSSDSLSITSPDGTVANIVRTDILINNGVIHVCFLIKNYIIMFVFSSLLT